MSTSENFETNAESTSQGRRWNPKWRKRKKHTAEGIDAQTQAALDNLRPQKDMGLFCKQCHRWIHWKDIHFEYVAKPDPKRAYIPGQDHGFFTRLSWCSCGSLLKEEAI